MQKSKPKKIWIWEFSKRVVIVITTLYIIERLFAMALLCFNGGMGLEVFIQTGSEVFLATVVSYAIKAGFENVSKIRRDSNYDD